MSYVVVVILTLLSLLCMYYALVNSETYVSYVQKPGPEELGLLYNVSSDNINTDCSVYAKYIDQQHNKDYYKHPRFLNPREACKDQCISGIWSENEDHTYGAHTCCKKACEAVEKGPNDIM